MVSPLAQAPYQLLLEGARAIGIVRRSELEVVVVGWVAVLSCSMILFADDRRTIANDVHLDPCLRSNCDPATRRRPREPVRD